MNSGDRNSGNRNSGNRNSGHMNSGHWNSGDMNSGFFNSKTPEFILAFNKPCRLENWRKSDKPWDLLNITLTIFIDESNMSEKEKEAYPFYKITGGYLKRFTYKEAWINSFKKASKGEIELLKKLPNFDEDVFFDITGISVSDYEK